MTERYMNLAISILQADISDTDTELEISSGDASLFSTSASYRVLVQDDDFAELMICSGRASTTLTVSRGAEGTTARAFATGSRVAAVMTAAGLVAGIDERVTTASDAASSALASHASDTTAIHGITDTGALALAADLADYQQLAEKSIADGYASLDGDGVVPDAELPGPPGADAHPATAVSVDSTSLTGTAIDVQGSLEELDAAITAGGAPTDATYLTATSNGSLSDEVVVGSTPAGELGGTWDAPTVDTTHSGSAHHDAATEGTGIDISGQVISVDLSELTAAGELGGTLDAPTVDTTHSGSAHHDAVTVGTGLDVTGQLVTLDLSEVSSGGELGGTMDAPTVDATHSGSTHSASTDTHIADTSAAHAASAVAFTPAGTIAATDVQAAIEEVASEATGGGAPTTLDYLVGTATGSLSAEIVAGVTPGGELGGTWASPTVDATHAGSAHTSVAKAGSTALTGAVTLTGGTNVTLTQAGQDISIAASGGSSAGFVSQEKWGVS